MFVSFISSYYETIVSIFLLLVSFVSTVATLCKARRSEARAEIVSKVPEIVDQIESVLPNGFGDVKLGLVLRQIEKLCRASRVPFDEVFMSKQVEKVLAAPTKKKNKSDKEV